jgi:hypothetical protein
MLGWTGCIWYEMMRRYVCSGEWRLLKSRLMEHDIAGHVLSDVTRCDGSRY